MKQIILASASPRRKELLKKLGLKFKTVKSGYKENFNLSADHLKLAKLLAEGKAKKAAKRLKNSVIISADTFVVLEKNLLGKPHTKTEAIRMLKQISGKSPSVITGIVVLDSDSGKKISKAIKTKVYIKKLSEKEIVNYIKTKEPLDKAGAFAIQGLGAVIVEKIEGDYSNVVGLPLYTLCEMLKKFNVRVL